MKLKGIIACEQSQAVTKEFRKLGHEVYSCDLKDCSGGHPEWHLKGSIFDIVKNYDFDFLIGHPPCTFLTVTGNKWMKDEYKDRFPTRKQDREDAVNFFMGLANLDIKHICLENPVGIMSTRYKKADQLIHPYFFGDEAMKATCLWLKNLPKLVHQKQADLFSEQVTHVSKGEQVTFKSGKKMAKWYVDATKLNSYDRAEVRSKTFNGIAVAMANQWSEYILNSKL